MATRIWTGAAGNNDTQDPRNWTAGEPVPPGCPDELLGADYPYPGGAYPKLTFGETGPPLRPFAVGDAVVCRAAGSWVDGKVGYIEALDVVSSDEILGHRVRIPGEGVTVLPSAALGRYEGKEFVKQPWPPDPAERAKFEQTLRDLKLGGWVSLPVYPPKPPCLADLYELAKRDALVGAAVKMWHLGDLTFEQMAVAVIRDLAAQRDRATRLATDAVERVPGKFEFQQGDLVGYDPATRGVVNVTEKMRADRGKREPEVS